MPFDPKPFPCKECGWILGESYRENGKHSTQLRIFRITKNPNKFEPKRPPLPTAVLFAAIQVNDGVVMCGHCGAKISWYANQTALDDIVSRSRSSRKVQDERIA